jgi:hypothetical protein
MDKRYLHHVWRKLRPISYWYFLLLFVVFGVIGAFALRQNNLTAIRLRDQVAKVDKENGDVEMALRELRAHVYGHMNANLSSGTGIQHPVQLKYRYERLVAAEKARVDNANKNIYTKAQRYCERKYPASTSGGPRVPCIAEYVTKNGEKQKSIPDDLYKFDFVSPIWSPDLAGFSILLSGIFLLLFLIPFGMERWLKYELDQ